MPDADRLGRTLVANESVARSGVACLLGFIAFKIVTNDSDAGVAPVLAAPVLAYAAWNVGMVVWMIRSARQPLEAASSHGSSYRATRFIGVTAAIRLVWLIPLARDPWWRSPALALLVLSTTATIVIAAIVAITAMAKSSTLRSPPTEA